ncbi:MAG: hypothetical protein J5967_08150, partial [Oscillospiraceae bacterium]|nr:hypothetical protein [Oscillospiraceae bacterium]
AILGVKPCLDGLLVDPCVPAGCKGFTAVRRFRGAAYRITVENPQGVQHGVASVTVDGKPVDSALLSPAPAGSTVTVKVVMG